MHLKSLEVSNFKAIEQARLSDLPAAVVIAGPNGCGKSCLLDAIRIWKAAYGGYNTHELDQAFSEFGVNVGQLESSLPTLFLDRTKLAIVRTTVSLSADEKSFLRSHASGLTAQRRRRERGLAIGRGPGRGSTTIEDRDAVLMREVDFEHQRELGEFSSELDQHVFTGEFAISPRTVRIFERLGGCVLY